MVDIHNHILFGMDDGPSTLEESIEMLKRGGKLGFRTFYLTSHHGKGKFKSENYEKNFSILEARVKVLNLGFTLKRGNEIYLDENMDKLLGELNFNSLNGKYLLVEFSPMVSVLAGKKMIEKILKRGYIPIVAHVERYIHFREKDLLSLKKLGARLQVNIGGKKEKYMEKLLKKGEIDFLGSDSHGIEKRTYDLEEDLKYLEKLIGRKKFKMMTSFIEEEQGDEKKISANGIFSSFLGNLFSGIGTGGNFTKGGEIKSRG